MPLVENFDSYNDGNLDGQGDWVLMNGNANCLQIQGTTKQAGTKGVQGIVANAGSYSRDKITGIDFSGNGSQIFYARSASNNNACYTYAMKDSDSSGGFAIFFTPAGNIEYNIDGQANGVILTGYNADQWYKLEVEWRTSDGKTRFRVDDGTWGNWVAGRGGTWGSPDMIFLMIHVNDGANADFFWDSFSGTAPTTNIKSVEGIEYASIGKIIGIAKASIKKIIGVQ